MIKPYLSLLANATPADLYPFARKRSPLWRDGYIARFAFVAPAQEMLPQEERFPDGRMQHPGTQVYDLYTWHQRLGEPHALLLLDDKEQMQALLRRPLPETVYTLAPPVTEAFYSYMAALRVILARTNNENLDPSYLRMPGRALRIAGLLASLHDTGTHTIELHALGAGAAHRGALAAGSAPLDCQPGGGRPRGGHRTGQAGTPGAALAAARPAVDGAGITSKDDAVVSGSHASL